MISKELLKDIQMSVEEAKKQKHEYVTPEHLLYVFTHDLVAKDILESCGLDVKELREDLLEFFKTKIPIVEDNAYEPMQSFSFSTLAFIF